MFTRNTWICIYCRIGRRYTKGQLKNIDKYKCSECGGELISLSDKFRIPKKKDKRGWKLFIEWLKNYNPYYKDSIETLTKV